MKLFSEYRNRLLKVWPGCPPQSGQELSEAVPTSVQLRNQFIEDIDENDRHFCSKAYIVKGEAYCATMGDVLELARNVPTHNLRDVWGD
jgi:hypothetical protein